MDLVEFLKGHENCCVKDVPALASALETFWLPQHDRLIRAEEPSPTLANAKRPRYSSADSQIPFPSAPSPGS